MTHRHPSATLHGADLKMRQPGTHLPLDPPTALHALPQELLAGWGEEQQQVEAEGWGSVPSVADLERAAGASYAASLDPRLATPAALAAGLPAGEIDRHVTCA